MEFEFDKFVKDLEDRQIQNENSKKCSKEEIELAQARRLRAELYHERWQNRIVWENK
jgi:hypothetical protein